MKWYIAVLKKYAVFTGRARRRQYWMFVFFNGIITVVLTVIEGIADSDSGGSRSTLATLYYWGLRRPLNRLSRQRLPFVLALLP